MPPALLDCARERARERGETLSGWIARAIAEQVRHDNLAQLLADLDADFGPVPQSALDYAESVWPD